MIAFKFYKFKDIGIEVFLWSFPSRLFPKTSEGYNVQNLIYNNILIYYGIANINKQINISIYLTTNIPFI